MGKGIIGKSKKNYLMLFIMLLIYCFCGNAVADGITIDGNNSDWSGYSPVAQGSGAITNMYALMDSTQLYIMANGTSMNEYSSIFIDSDNKYSTGYMPDEWNELGADYLLEDNYLMKYSGTGTDWTWTQVSEINCSKATSVAESSIQLSQMNISNKNTIKLALLKGSGNLCPIIGESPAVVSLNKTKVAKFDKIPYAIGMAIDDLGWNYTSPRTYTIDDYKTVINVGKNAGTRIMTAWILCDYDKSGICKKEEYNLPSASFDMTERGLNFNPILDSNADSVMKLVGNSAQYIEFGLHGVSHAHYKDGISTGLEWANVGDGVGKPASTWGWDAMTLKAKCFLELQRQFFDSTKSSFPRSFVPPGHAYYYNENSSETTGALLNKYGVKYANGGCELFTSLDKGGIDNGVLFIKRAYGPYYDIPGEIPKSVPTSNYGWIEAHFPNYWGAEEQWTNYLLGINNSPDRYLPKNTVQCSSQWLYRKYATISESNGTTTIDVSNMTNDAYTYDLLGNLVLKTPLYGKHLASAEINNDAQVVGYYEDSWGYGYIVIGHKSNEMGRLSKQKYTLKCTFGDTPLESYVDLGKATFNVHSYTISGSYVTLGVEIYGTQNAIIHLPYKPKTVTCSKGLKINSWIDNGNSVKVNITGQDIQGTLGTIRIYK